MAPALAFVSSLPTHGGTTLSFLSGAYIECPTNHESSCWALDPALRSRSAASGQSRPAQATNKAQIRQKSVWFQVSRGTERMVLPTKSKRREDVEQLTGSVPSARTVAALAPVPALSATAAPVPIALIFALRLLAQPSPFSFQLGFGALDLDGGLREILDPARVHALLAMLAPRAKACQVEVA